MAFACIKNKTRYSNQITIVGLIAKILLQLNWQRVIWYKVLLCVYICKYVLFDVYNSFNYVIERVI